MSAWGTLWNLGRLVEEPSTKIDEPLRKGEEGAEGGRQAEL